MSYKYDVEVILVSVRFYKYINIEIMKWVDIKNYIFLYFKLRNTIA